MTAATTSRRACRAIETLLPLLSVADARRLASMLKDVRPWLSPHGKGARRSDVQRARIRRGVLKALARDRERRAEGDRDS
jgi:hypothetical protein